MNQILLTQELYVHVQPKVKFIVTSGSVVGGGVAGITYESNAYDNSTNKFNLNNKGKKILRQ